MGALVGLVLAAGILAAAGGYVLYQHFADGLPDVDGLRGYQPKVMSRVFASDGQLLADLANERRIYLPINAIPEIVTPGPSSRRRTRTSTVIKASTRWPSCVPRSPT